MNNKNTTQYEEKTTTIAIPMKVKEGIQRYGLKGESYSEIIVRLLKSAHERMLSDVLMDETDCITVEEALAEAKQKWQK
jgi:hypothetical protein